MISNILKGQQCGNSVASRCESDIAMILFDKIRGESHCWSHHPSTGDGLKWASFTFFCCEVKMHQNGSNLKMCMNHECFFCPGLKWFSASIFLIEIPIDL